MAQRKGMTVRMDNSDNKQRKYEINCEVTVEENEARDVRSINVTKDGAQIAYGSINGLQRDTPSVSVNINGLPLSEHADCLNEIYAFAEQAVKEVTETE